MKREDIYTESQRRALNSQAVVELKRIHALPLHELLKNLTLKRYGYGKSKIIPNKSWVSNSGELFLSKEGIKVRRHPKNCEGVIEEVVSEEDIPAIVEEFDLEPESLEVLRRAISR